MPRQGRETLKPDTSLDLHTPDAWSRFRGRTVGVIVLAAFGAYSMYGWTMQAIPSGRRYWFIAIALVTAILLWRAITHLVLHRRVPKPDLIARYRRYYAIRFFAILTIEVAAIILASPVSAHFNRPDLIPQAINIVVGVHFLPLGKLFKMPIYYATSAAILASAVTSLFISSSSLSYAINSGGTGLALWITAVVVLRTDAWILRASHQMALSS